ncbi:MAG TPA: protein kinase, partial [Chloroflexota bacterium]|nr:protein kinase [Chloroflexota bacterium]
MINGVVAGRYRIERLLGEGGMSRVYQATDLRLDRAVALKVLREQFAADAEFVERFAHEARTAASLSHPNVVNVFDVGQDGEQSFIVMELVEGRPLREYIDSDAPFEPRDVVTVLDQLCDALDYAHGRGVVHRDLKPENVLLTPQGRVKIGDFGIARSVSAETLTAAGTVLGSAYYISPEQAQGQPATARSDIYAAGVMAYEMLTG